MRRIVCIVAAAGVLGGALMPSLAVAEGPPRAAQQGSENPPPRIGDMVTCATNGMKMRLAADTPSAVHGGQTYYFCTDDEKRAFLRDREGKPED